MRIKIMIFLILNFYLGMAQILLDSLNYKIGASVYYSEVQYNLGFLAPERTPDYFLENYALSHVISPIIGLELEIGMKYKKWELLGTYSFRIKSHEENKRPADLSFPANSNKNEYLEFEKYVYLIRKNHILNYGLYYRQKKYQLDIATYKKFYSPDGSNFAWVVFGDIINIKSHRIGAIIMQQKRIFIFNLENKLYISSFEIAKYDYRDKDYDKIEQKITSITNFQIQIVSNIRSNRFLPFLSVSLFYKYDKIRDGLSAEEYGIIMGMEF